MFQYTRGSIKTRDLLSLALASFVTIVGFELTNDPHLPILIGK